jgi:hypothetical protein
MHYCLCLRVTFVGTLWLFEFFLASAPLFPCLQLCWLEVFIIVKKLTLKAYSKPFDVFCLKVEYYLDNNKQLGRSDAANATAMDQHAAIVFDFLDKDEKDKRPMRLKLMGMNNTLNLAQLDTCIPRRGPCRSQRWQEKREKAQQEGQKPQTMGPDEEV